MEEKIISAEISFYPLRSSDYIHEIEKVISIIKDSNLDFQVNALSTIISGPNEQVISLIRKIVLEMDKVSKFVLVAKISNLCGCEVE
ncbi:MAG: YkoF family thiamine/hydroxymethylpyrimidine-binding protein [Candidatus Kapaibacteriota bacterium]